MEIKSYLTSDFISEFLKNRPGDDLSENKIPWLTLYRFFNNGTKLNIDCDPAELVKYIDDPVFRNVIDQYLQSSERVKLFDWKKAIFISNEYDSPYKFCFTELKDTILEIAIRQHGLPSTSANDWEIIRKITTPITLNLTNEKESLKFSSWLDLKSKMLPFHSIVICDNYLMANYEYTFKNNFAELLKVILEDCKKQPNVQVTIVTNDFLPEPNKFIKQAERQKLMEEKYFPMIYEKIKTVIEKELEMTNIELSIIKTELTSEYHDRHIFTNSQFIKSENSFSNYFDRNNKVHAKSPIQISILSYPSDNSERTWGESINPHLKTLYKIVKKKNINYLGNHPNQNSIFKYIH